MTPDSETTLSQRIGEFFSNPAMVAVAWIATVVGVVLTIYFYVAGNHKPLLTYRPQEANTAVVRAGQSSKIAVSYAGQPLVEDVTSAQVAFWNAGDLAIHGVLKPLRIYTDPKALILEARIIHPTRDVIGLKIDESEMDKGNVIIRWDLLEHNDGGVVQLVFTGKTNAKIVADAVIEGQPSIHRSDSEDSYKGRGSYINIFVVAFLLLSSFLKTAINRLIAASGGRSKLTFLGAAVVAILVSVPIAVAINRYFQTLLPPFDF